MIKTIVACPHCENAYSSKGIFTHILRVHGSEDQKSKYKSGFTEADRYKIKVKQFDAKMTLLKDYYQNPSKCQTCSVELDWFKRGSKYCDKSCAAKSTNKLKVRSKESTQKTSESLKRSHQKRLSEFVGPPIPTIPKRDTIDNGDNIGKHKIEFVGEYSKVYICTCKFCSVKFIKPTTKRICDACKIVQGTLYVDYRFRFNVYNYPDLFDLVELNKHGWYSPRGKSGKWNIMGYSRDHKVSVSEAITHRYDPFYITHPINCELMPHYENNKKKSKSSISYEELILLVDAYEITNRKN